MKDKILYLIIGILIGAIVTISAFLIYNKAIKTNSKWQEMMQMNRNGQSGSTSNGDIGDPPQVPNGGTPPEKPTNSNNHNNV